MQRVGERQSVHDVLVVDDDETVLRGWQRLLRAEGKIARVASDRSGALACVDAGTDLAIVELNLAGSERGIDVIRELKELVPGIYTVLISGAMSVAQAVSAMREGVDDCEIKPVSPQQLLRRIEQGEAARLGRGQVLTLDEVEWEHIARVMADCDGNVSHAAQALGLHRQSLQRKLRQLRPPPARRADDERETG
ncbi:MAG: response regulator [Kofleriaceae bacterium]